MRLPFYSVTTSAQYTTSYRDHKNDQRTLPRITSMDNNITATRLFLASPGTAVFVGCQSKLELSAYESAFCGLRYR